MKQAGKHGSSKTAMRPTPLERKRPKLLPDASGFSARERGAIYKALTIIEGRIRDEGFQFSSPLAVMAWLNIQLSTLRRETFVGLFLDSQNRFIAMEILASGSIDEARVYPRVVVEYALTHNAAAVIFAHNHPSGLLEPSTADIALTKRLKFALDQLDIRVLDHFIVGGKGAPFSFSERGMI